MGFAIIGTGSALPSKTINNDQLSTFLDTSNEWIVSRTGILERRVCSTETLTDLSAQAATAALTQAGLTPQDLDLIICASITGDTIIPSQACMIQSALGANCPAFDINSACTGFIYALDIAAGYYARERVKHVLIVAAEAMSRIIDWTDRSTCILFGDGAGAVVLGPGDDLLSIKISARGDDKALFLAGRVGNSPFSAYRRTNPFVFMDGQEVFKFAVGSLVQDLRDVIAQGNLQMEEITYVLPHQANMRIINAAIPRLGLAPQKFLTNIARLGNTSAASIPILLDESSREGRFQPGDILAFSAFGGGLTSGACVFRWGLPHSE